MSKKIVLILVAIAVIIALLLFWKQHRAEQKNTLVQPINKGFLVHQTTLAALKIPTPTGNANGAEFLVTLSKTYSAKYANQSDADPVAPEIIQLIQNSGEQKIFSIYPELIAYPTTPAKLNFMELLPLNGIRNATKHTLAYLPKSNLPASEQVRIMQDILLAGDNMIMEKDFNNIISVLAGIGVEHNAALALADYYAGQGNTALSENYKRFAAEDDAFKNKIVQLTGDETKIQTYSLILYVWQKKPDNYTLAQVRGSRSITEAQIKDSLQKMTAYDEPIAQLESLSTLGVLSACTNAPLESSLASAALQRYASTSDSQVVRNLAEQLLQPGAVDTFIKDSATGAQ